MYSNDTLLALMFMRTTIFCLFFLIIGVSPLWAAPLLQAGFRTLGVYDPETELRLNLAVWYPTKRMPTLLDYKDWIFTAARNAPPEEGRHPLILLSHDSAGSRFSLYQLAIALAQKNFVVASVTHQGDQLDNLQNIFTIDQFDGRCHDISASIDILLQDSNIEPMIDTQRIGMLGVGAGALTALLLANARPDSTGWKNYCSRASKPNETSLYCTRWARRRMTVLAADPNLSKKRRDSRIRAMALVAPWYGMFFTSKESLRQVTIPVLLINAEHDKLNLPVFHAQIIRNSLPKAPEYLNLEEGEPASLISPCSPELAQTWAELCLSVSEKTREKVQKILAESATAFFTQHLAGVLPPPPPEPDEDDIAAAKAAAEKAAESAPQSQGSSRKKRSR